MTAPLSPFLRVSATEHVASNATMFAIRDRYPVSPGHTLVIPRRAVASVFELDADEWRDALALVAVARADLLEQFGPDGFNVGFNDGAAAGQTVFHAHIHIIPRHAGDVPDPRGGVRHVIPARGNYLAHDDQEGR